MAAAEMPETCTIAATADAAAGAGADADADADAATTVAQRTRYRAGGLEDKRRRCTGSQRTVHTHHPI